ncbi:CK5P3 protein, partial [Pomatostomus ruficeps]|nr:CK5P3 protein [Pomatostomus ruficeps]
ILGLFGVCLRDFSVPRYVERVAALLRQKLLQAELLLAKRDTLARKRREALAEQEALEPKLQQLQERTRELQKLVREGWRPPRPPQTPSFPPLSPLPGVLQIEADISKRYGGRPVNLMGINL